MNKITMFPGRPHQRRGIALVTVLAILTLAAVLILAFFSVSKTELSSSSTYSRGLEAQQLSQTAINLVMHQIRSASSDKGYAWASQPGMLRIWDSNGFKSAFKLYSDDKMVETSKTGIGEDTKDLAGWDDPSRRGIFVDMNQPVIREEGSVMKYFFPILDPRAHDTTNQPASRDIPQGSNASKTSVEGFEYTTTGSWQGSKASKGKENYPTTPPVGRGPSQKGLPMPVKWLYQLEDGTLGTLDNSRRYIPITGTGIPSKDNPMVARLAFWTDDETTKINVNTAAGGRAWDMPRAGGTTDRDYGIYQPRQREYQRYPGHPATTQLAPVLFPNRLQFGQGGYDASAIEKIYEMVPRVVPGGSQGGSLDLRMTKTKQKSDLGPLYPDKDRLFATIDEFIFQAPYMKFNDQTGAIISRDVTLPRKTYDFGPNYSWGKLDAEFLDRTKFFLTVSSRAPETTLFNTPRISMWPSYFGDPAPGKDREYFSAFDIHIRNCAEVGVGRGSGPTYSEKAQYHFQRKDSESRSYDYDQIPRNQELYSYMQWLLKQQVPGVGKSMKSKYDRFHARESDQILTEIFDYIRSLNLYDDSLLAENYIAKGQFTKGMHGFVQWINPPDHRSYTNYRMDFSSGDHIGLYQAPGHGQVAPIEINGTKGFGRFPGLMEAGIAVICCAEDNGDMGGPGFMRVVGDNSLAAKWKYSDNTQRMYSNIAPLSSTTSGHLASIYGSFQVPPDPTVPAAGAEPDAPGDPAWWDNTPRGQWCKALVTNSGRWNKALSEDKVLTNRQKRVQAILLFQAFTPSYGWTSLKADFRMRVQLSGDASLNGQKLELDQENPKLWRSPFSPHFEMHGGRDTGGVMEPRCFLLGQAENTNAGAGKNIKKYGIMPRYATWKGSTSTLADNASARNASSAADASVNGYPFVSAPVTLDAGAEGIDAPIDFSGLTMTISLYPGGGFGSDTEGGFPNGGTFNKANPNIGNDEYTQRTQIVMEPTKMPAPRLREGQFGRVEGPSNNRFYVEGTQVQAGEFWTWHREGCMTELGNGRLGRLAGWEGDGGIINTQDVTRSYVLKHGDIRISCTRRELGTNSDEFVKHPKYNNTGIADRIASNFARTTSDSGYGRPAAKKTLLRGYDHGGRFPHLPDTFEFTMQKWGDFDNTQATEMDGPFINKPDEGNSRGVDINDYNPWPEWGSVPRPHIPYFNESWLQETAGAAFYSPNRVVPGPGILGSLSTGAMSNRPWQTLLFRPMIANGRGTISAEVHPGYEDPKDHYFLDFFWMPCVEPWSISEPLSTAGKININYQIQPFTYINRTSGIRAVMGSEEMLTIPRTRTVDYKNGWGYGNGYDSYYDTGGTLRTISLRSRINVDETLRQFGKKFNTDGELFRTASEICEHWLVPVSIQGLQLSPSLEETRSKVWDADSPSGLGMVGDNSRERPYTDIIARVTTKSNTYQVHYRSQILRQALQSPANPASQRTSAEYATFDPDMDTVVAEYRGSSIIERFVDPEDPTIPDYAVNPDSEPLDQYYRFRVVSSKRFSP